MKKTEWIRCPVCGNKTRDRIREDTVLKNYPLYCPKCKQETLIEAKNLQIIVIKEPDAQDAEPITPRIVLSWVIGLFYWKAKKHRITPPLPLDLMIPSITLSMITKSLSDRYQAAFPTVFFWCFSPDQKQAGKKRLLDTFNK